MTNAREHWDDVYSKKAPTEVSWYAPRLETSHALIHEAGLGSEARVLDVGGGASTLVDDLLDDGFDRVTVLDLAQSAVDQARSRLGERATRVAWRVDDVLTADLPHAAYDIWHDRAVFHFMTTPDQRAAYRAQVERALAPGGHVVMATFALDGPTRCSGLEVVRYDADSLAAELGPAFTLVSSCREQHRTPGGATQSFVFVHLRRVA